MKSVILCSVSILMISTTAFAVPGGSQLTCQSAANSRSKQNLVLQIARMNGPGTAAPVVSISVNGSSYPTSTSDINQQYGETIHDAALGVIVVTANNWGEANTGWLAVQVMAVPGTVKAFDQNGNPVKWTLQDDDGGECIDGYGKAFFQGVFTGNLQNATTSTPLDNQIMDCTLTYDTGSAC